MANRSPHSDSYIQVGSLTLKLSSRLPSFSSPTWTPLTHSFLESSTNLFEPSCKNLVGILSDAFKDLGMGFEAEWKRVENEVRVRCKVCPGSGRRKSVRKGKAKEGVVRRLLEVLNRNWEGDEGLEGDRLLGLTAQDDQSMQEIYASVPSPTEPRFRSASSTSPLDRELYDCLENYENRRGVRTFLYRYQLRSVAKMLKMETQPERLVDPLFTPFQEAGRKGVYYVNLSNWDIQRHPGWYDLPRGGILCEQMGTGKTLMCLALIVSSLHQPTVPPPTDIDISPTTTDVAERTYPFSSHSDLRALSGFPRHAAQLVFPSLVELCANKLAIHDPSAINSPYLPTYTKHLLNRRTFYCTFPLDDECMRASKRRTMEQTVRKMYLAKATLVVVPAILIEQWKDEIGKHLEEGTIKVLEVGKEGLPPIEQLLEYDVILMAINHEEFGSEESARHKESDSPNSSVLLKARWKRIILDEGHVAHSKTSNAMRLAMQLSVERRWLVSGTPTRHLRQGAEIEMEGLVKATISRPTIQTDNNHAQKTMTRRTWSKRDVDDATRIGVMIAGFLAAEPFKSEALFQRLVTSTLSRQGGPDFGAVARMKYIVNGLMVKHGPQVIDEEARLPPSTISKEVLQFDPMQRITYNVLAALVSSNVLTSGGEDADYFLHPRNAESYNQVVNNLHLACFWYSAREMDAAGCLERTRDWLSKHPEASEQVRMHLEESCHHLETAISSPGWDDWMNNAISIPVDGSSFPPIIKHAWSDSFDTQPDMIDLHSLITLRELNRRGVSLQDLYVAGLEFRKNKRDKGERQKSQPGQKANNSEGRKRAGTAAQAPIAVPVSPDQRRGSGRKRKGDALDERLEEAARNANAAADYVFDLPLRLCAADPQQPRPLPSVMLTKSRSAKVNYVLRSIQEAEKEDKFVIFGDNYELGHLTEGLDMLDITSTFVGAPLPPSERTKALDRFNKPEIRVCLLDLNLAARGLNLVVANRMIFLAPVWNLDVQAQAIKRVHRIGQTKATRVEILITEGTFEEDIAKRSTTSRSADEEKSYTRAMIENPRFVYPESTESHTFAVRFTPNGESVTPETSNTATPVETILVTPASKESCHKDKFLLVPSPKVEAEAALNKIVGGAYRREAGGAQKEVKPKKKVRLAVA
ncbi:hypothetical protein IAR55_003426 [Kwoniella newhampshirensis]|uniref:Helicase C-terminal domain-containing protein n=1 Tax=Kwoniella newhampshirensis TaxID=1651941 RepID=A0AAW0YMF4_9TREE